MPAAFKSLNPSEWTFPYKTNVLGDFAPGHALYGTADANNDYIAVQTINSVDPMIEAGTVFRLSADQEAATSFSLSDSIGADYNFSFFAKIDDAAHIGIITSGDFLTNTDTGAALPGNAYANMETLGGPPLTFEPQRDVLTAPSCTTRAEII